MRKLNLAAFLLVLSLPVSAGFWGGATQPHTHSSSSDGGRITNLLLGTGAGLGSLGIGLAGSAGHMLHTYGGNWLIDGDSEQSIIFRRTAITNNPIFSIGRLTVGGDGHPNMRIFYTDDVTSEKPIFAWDDKGTFASVGPSTGTGVCAFEAYRASGDVYPWFRLNRASGATLELGSGDGADTDSYLRRTAASVMEIGGMIKASTVTYIVAAATGSLTLADGTFQTVSFPTETIDVRGEWDGNLFTAQQTGYYKIGGSIDSAVGTGAGAGGLIEQFWVDVDSGGSQPCITRQTWSEADVTNTNWSVTHHIPDACVLSLTAGQTVRFRVQHDDGVGSASSTWATYIGASKIIIERILR